MGRIGVLSGVYWGAKGRIGVHSGAYRCTGEFTPPDPDEILPFLYLDFGNMKRDTLRSKRVCQKMFTR